MNVDISFLTSGGSIPIEAAINWPHSYHIAGDIHPQAVPRAVTNVQELNIKRTSRGEHGAHVDITCWDSTNMPLRDQSVDVFVTDLVGL